MTWNIRLVYMDCAVRKAVELRKVHYDILGCPISHSSFSHDSTNQAEVNRFEVLVNEAFEKPILKFAS
jgi:hypothetical protein